MHPIQYVFIAMMLCVLAFLVLNTVGWVVRRYFAWGARVSTVYVEPRYDWATGEADEQTAYVNIQAENAGINPPDTSINIGIRPFDVGDVPPDLTYEKTVTILSRLVTPAGKPRYSGKKIYNLVGGNYNEFVELMRQLRIKDPEPAEEPTVLTPFGGRPTKASYYTDPDLVYEPPEPR